MAREINYSTITNEDQKKAKAMEDVKFWLGDKFKKMENALKQGVADGEITSKNMMVGFISIFLGIEGYPARVWADLIAPDLPKEPIVASTPDPETVCVSANGPQKPVL